MFCWLRSLLSNIPISYENNFIDVSCHHRIIVASRSLVSFSLSVAVWAVLDVQNTLLLLLLLLIVVIVV